MSTVTTYLWFDDQARQAAEYYTSLIENSRVTGTTPGPDGGVLMVTFELDGQQFAALNGGPYFTFTEAASVFVSCPTQERVDELWTELTRDGSEGRCGWLKDRYGLSWQIVPAELPTLLGDPDPDRVKRAAEALHTMKKIDIAALRAAADGA